MDYADDEGLIKLGTNHGAFEADLVVCTLPLGVLKQGYHITLQHYNARPYLYKYMYMLICIYSDIYINWWCFVSCAVFDSAVKFVPPLPEEKRRSIEKLGCGTFNVVVLFFSTIFWDKQVHGPPSTPKIWGPMKPSLEFEVWLTQLTLLGGCVGRLRRLRRSGSGARTSTRAAPTFTSA